MAAERFIRVGTTLYKIVNRPLLSGDYLETRIVWSYEVLRQDYGKEFIGSIPKYDGFCIVPDHICYKLVVGTFLNLYEEFYHQPVQGDCIIILDFIRHIFGDQYELGLDYLQLLYTCPTQKLPILLLVSSERNTGKTTFLNFLKALFGGNMTFNTNEDFRSQFNSDWTNKLIVAVDEVLLDRREDSERLKNLSTSLLHKSEAKGKDRIEVQFFAKFILCSNNETNPIIIESGETRYWVRKVNRFKTEDTLLLSKLVQQIPAFLFLLGKRKISTAKRSRMWFAYEQYRTDALKRIIACSRNRLEVELKELLLEIIENNDLSEVSFCLNDLIPLFNRINVKAEKHQLRRIVHYEWGLEPCSNSLSYTTYEYNYHNDGGYSAIRRVGRYYTVTKELIHDLF